MRSDASRLVPRYPDAASSYALARSLGILRSRRALRSRRSRARLLAKVDRALLRLTFMERALVERTAPLQSSTRRLLEEAGLGGFEDGEAVSYYSALPPALEKEVFGM